MPSPLKFLLIIYHNMFGIKQLIIEDERDFGNGVKAMEDIMSDRFIGEYLGDVISLQVLSFDFLPLSDY